MRKFLSVLLAMTMVLSLTVTGFAIEDTATTREPEVMTEEATMAGKTVILHTNDVHGAIAGYAYITALKADYEAKEKIYNELSSQKTGEDKVIAAVDKALEKVRKTPVPTRKAASAEDRDDDDSSVIKTI